MAKEGDMTDQEFEELKEAIKEKFRELEKLQKKYIRETGKRYGGN